VPCTSAPILDEPTSALGVKQSGIVLKYIIQARSIGRGVIFITHNPHHAYPVGDRFVLLRRGRMLGSLLKSETTLDQLSAMMAGGAELEQLSHELAGLTTDPAIAEVAKEVATEAADVKTTAR
jgi:simple sugar transport system ATP-binding protein